MKICATGKYEKMSRNELAKAIEDLGYEFTDNLSNDVKLLLCADKKSKSGKMKDAEKGGIEIKT